MKLEWMGEYRPLVEAMIGMCNAYSQAANQIAFQSKYAAISAVELQVLEYILENEERCENMSQVARRLCISQSNFSKIVKRLVEKNLLEKFRTANNNKNIIIRASDNGRAFYADYSSGEMTDVWRRIFVILNGLDAETVQKFTDSLNEFSAVLQSGEPHISNASTKLIKLE